MEANVAGIETVETDEQNFLLRWHHLQIPEKHRIVFEVEEPDDTIQFAIRVSCTE